MKNNRISPKQATLMIVMFIIGSSSLFTIGIEAKKDIWMAFLLAGGASVLIMLIYARLLTVLPDKDFYDTLEHFLGKVGSKIALIFLTFFCLQLCAIVLNHYALFVVTIGLPETPLIVAICILIIISAFAVKDGIEVIGRWSAIFVLFILSFLAISLLLATKNMDIANILPVLDGGFAPLAKGTFGIISFPFAETMVFLLVFPVFKKGTSVKKIYWKGLLIGGVFILLSSLSDLLVLGSNVASSKYYPTYATMATIQFGDFLQRLEVFAAIVFVISVFFKITVLLYGSCKSMSRIFGLKQHRFIVIPITFLVAAYATMPADNMIFYHEWGGALWPVYAPIFQVIIPLILLIIIEIKIRKQKKNGTLQKSVTGR